MLFRKCALSIAWLILLAGVALADAPLKTALGLTMDQAREVDQIQAKHRKLMQSARHDFTEDSRRLRRARLANDSKAVAELEVIVANHQAAMRKIRENEDAEVRKVLTPEQSKKFDAYIETREAMVGSSRDARDMRRKP